MSSRPVPSYPTGDSPLQSARTYSDAIDAWLADVLGDLDFPPGVALVAIGGSGRRELAPRSDLDLLLTFRRKCPPDLADNIWYPIWDSGLKLGHSLRSVGDTLALAKSDLDTATALLDARVVLGDLEVGAGLVEDARAQWRSRGPAWLPELGASMAERHERFGDVTFSLEPDLKHGRGGLRDAQSLRWAEMAGAELPIPTAALAASYRMLLGARVALHLAAGRPLERLEVEYRDDVASRTGYADPDVMMREISAAGRAIAWGGDELFYDLTTTSTLDLRGDPTAESRGPRIALRDTVPADAAAALRVGLLAAEHRARIEIATLDQFSTIDPPEVWTASMRDDFVSLLRTGRPAIAVIEALDHRGVWTTLVPEWEPAQSRPQHNPYHSFTVDRHLLETAAVAATLPSRRPDLLVIAALLHDIGKAYPELGDHSAVGGRIAEQVLTRMGYDTDDVETVVMLTEHHLLLPDTATRRDLDDPSTLNRVADTVGHEDRLELLRELTIADGRATGRTAWSDWKANLVDELSARVEAVLRGAPSDDLVSLEQFRPELLELAARLPSEPSSMVVRGSGDRIEVVTTDGPGLFSRIAGALALHGLDIRDARVGTVDGIAIEEIVVESSFSTPIPWEEVEAVVRRAIRGELALRARLAQRAAAYPRKEMPHAMAPAVRVITDEGPTSAIVEVAGPDAIGLLYRITEALAEFDLDITRAMVTTLGHDIVDVFYVDSDGLDLGSDRMKRELRLALLHAIDSQ